MKVLAGDLGGTKTLLAIAECNAGTVTTLMEQRYESADFPGLLPILQNFIARAGNHVGGISQACVAVAGPVNETAGGQTARITNLPWTLDSTALAQGLGIARVRLINDFSGIGYGIEALSAHDLVNLQTGTPHPRGTRAVIGAGTGLGEGLLTWQGDHYEVLPSEGGHADFAPADAEQDALLCELRVEFGHVSWERLLCGSGLIRIYEFLRGRGVASETSALRSAMQSDDPAAAISKFALEQGDTLAARALDLFVRLYGAQTGNLALTCLATGGMYVAGGIAAKILDKLQDGTFMRAFLAKGRMAAVLQNIPVHVVRNSKIGLLGAALAAARL